MGTEIHVDRKPLFKTIYFSKLKLSIYKTIKLGNLLIYSCTIHVFSITSSTVSMIEGGVGGWNTMHFLWIYLPLGVMAVYQILPKAD